jgi:retinol dehydrogenase 12
MQPTLLKFIQDQFWKVEPVVRADLTGKTIVIVGANVGLGFEAAKHFASMNPKRLVLGCRSQEKGQAAVQGKFARDWDWAFFVDEFCLAIQTTGFKNVELALVDVSSFASVSAFADAFIRDGSQIDILVYNAAVILQQYSATRDGWEET